MNAPEGDSADARQKAICHQGRWHLARRSSQDRVALQQDEEKGSGPECPWPHPRSPLLTVPTRP